MIQVVSGFWIVENLEQLTNLVMANVLHLDSFFLSKLWISDFFFASSKFVESYLNWQGHRTGQASFSCRKYINIFMQSFTSTKVIPVVYQNQTASEVD